MSTFYVPLPDRVYRKHRYYIPVPGAPQFKHEFIENSPWIVPLKEPGLWSYALLNGPAYVYTFPGTLNQLMQKLDVDHDIDFSQFVLCPTSAVLRMLNVT